MPESSLPDDAQLDALADQVHDQLARLQATPGLGAFRAVGPGREGRLPPAPAQEEAIERLAGEPFESFWQKYRRHLRRDLCLPGGMLHEQWKKWRDLETEPALRISYAWLAAMGLPIASVAPLAVAETVFLLDVVLKVGIETVCEGIEDDDTGAADGGRAETADGPH